MTLALSVVAAPTEEPLTLDEAKAQLRVTGDDDNATIQSYVKAAREHLEETRGRAYCTQTLQRRLDCFPACGYIELPRPPLVSISWIKYVAPDGTLTTWSSTLYQFDAFSEPGRVAPAYGQFWPFIRPQFGAVQIQYVAGYGAAAAVPERVKQAMRILVEDAWDKGSAAEMGSDSDTRRAIDALLPPVEAMWIGL